ncbi:unnamed protein product, partial [Scytosiphon promiscuus]
MASATVLRPPRRADAGGGEQLRVGKRPRPAAAASRSLGVRRRPLDEHKWALLQREQELERRRVAEAIRRLEAIEELRRKARERKLDRDKRRVEFAARLEHSVLTLQRCERGRQARKRARVRARAVGTIIKWVRAKIRHAAMLKAVRNRTILRIMVSVEHLVEERLGEAIFFVKNAIAVRAFRNHRAARIIQGALRRRTELVRRCADTIVGAVRCWLARGALRRARIRRGIRRQVGVSTLLAYRGSLSRRNLGLNDADPLSNTATREFVKEGRWWDSGLPAVPPRPRWGTQRVENEEARSRQRALSLADLIRSGQQENDSSSAASGGGGGGGGAGDWRANAARDSTRRAEAVPSWMAKRWGNGGRPDVRNSAIGDGLNNCRPAAPTSPGPIGFGKVITSQRAVSMVDPRQAEKAALLHDLERRRARKREPPPNYHKLSIVEKHLHREREFHEQRDRRRAAAEREARRREKQRAKEIAEAARQKALQAELVAKEQQEKATRRLQKVKEYKEKKAARELAEKKALAAQREEERRAKAAEDARRAHVDRCTHVPSRKLMPKFSLAKARTLPLHACRKLRVVAARYTATPQDAGGRGTEAAQKLSGTAHPTHHRAKKHASVNNSRAALAPIAVTNNGSNHMDRDVGRKRQRLGSCPTLPGVGRRSVKVVAGMRDGRRKVAPHGANVPSLPVVPGWKAMAAGGTGRVEKRKRVRRRPPKKGGVAAEGDRDRGRSRDGGLADEGGTIPAGDDFDRSLGARNSAADLERLLVSTSGQDGGKTEIRSTKTNFEQNSRGGALQQTAREGQGGVPRGRHQTGEEEAAVDADRGDQDRSSQLAEGESLSMETLDSAFPIPGDACDSGGGKGLGETSSPEHQGLLSPGWSSRSSRRSSEQGETSSDFLSDSAAIREGQALLSGEVVVDDGRCARKGEVRTGGGATGGSSAKDDGPESLEIRSSGEAEAGPAVPGSIPATAIGRAMSPGAIVQLPSSAEFPDSISDMSDNRTFIDQYTQQEDEGRDSKEERRIDGRSPSPFCGRGSDDEDAPDAVGPETGVESTDFLAVGRSYTADHD